MTDIYEKLKHTSNPKHLHYLKLVIPESTTYGRIPTAEHFSDGCHFRDNLIEQVEKSKSKGLKTSVKAAHLWHSELDIPTNKQLNTVIDLLVNFSQSCYEADTDIKTCILKSNTQIPERTV